MCNIIWDFLHIFYTFNGLVGLETFGMQRCGMEATRRNKNHMQKRGNEDVDEDFEPFRSLQGYVGQRSWRWPACIVHLIFCPNSGFHIQTLQHCKINTSPTSVPRAERHNFLHRTTPTSRRHSHIEGRKLWREHTAFHGPCSTALSAAQAPAYG